MLPLFDAQPNSFAWSSGAAFAPSQSHLSMVVPLSSSLSVSPSIERAAEHWFSEGPLVPAILPGMPLEIEKHRARFDVDYVGSAMPPPEAVAGLAKQASAELQVQGFKISSYVSGTGAPPFAATLP